MPSVRVPMECKNPVLKKVKGVLYGRKAGKAGPVFVPTAVHPTRDCLAVPRFPSFESILGLDAELYESWVTCEDNQGKEHRFLIAAQYSRRLPTNRALKRVLPEVSWKGGLVVMQGGSCLSVVNIRCAHHRKMAEIAVRKFLVETAPVVAHAMTNNIRLVIPTEL